MQNAIRALVHLEGTQKKEEKPTAVCTVCKARHSHAFARVHAHVHTHTRASARTLSSTQVTLTMTSKNIEAKQHVEVRLMPPAACRCNGSPTVARNPRVGY